MSKLFIDTANIADIQKALSRGIIDGVTTNPSLIGKEDRPAGDITEVYVNHMKQIVSSLEKNTSDAHLSVEVFTLDPKEMVDQAEDLVEKIGYKSLAIKVPFSYKGRDYLEVVRKLSSDGIDVNCTCCATEGQLELAAKAGARYVSLFYNRLKDHYLGDYPKKEDGSKCKIVGANKQLDPRFRDLSPLDFSEIRALDVLRSARSYIEKSHLPAEIILGSIRHGYDITNGWANGAHIVTAGYKQIEELFSHPVTEASVKGFDADFKKWAGTQ